MASNTREAWLRGPVKDIPLYLQPVAHALLQAREEVNKAVSNFPEDKLWIKPAGAASVAFHLQHITGVLDRLFSYARGCSLTEAQLQFLAAEGNYSEHITLSTLIQALNEQVEKSIYSLPLYKETLLQPREVGRAKLPSTTLGLLVHAAEHTMRHLGQLLVTIRFVSNQNN